MNNALLSMIGMGGNFQPVASYMAGQEMADRRQSNALRNAIEMQRMTQVDQPTYGLTPIFDASGNMYQLSNQGGIAQVPNSDGVPYVKPIDWRDSGDAWVGSDPITGQPRGYQPIQPPPEVMPEFQGQQEAAKTEARKNEEYIAERRAKKPLFERAAADFDVQSQNVIDIIDELIGTEDKPGSIGWSTSGPVAALTGWVPFSPAGVEDSELEAVRSNQVIQIMKALKDASPTGSTGFGGMTDREGMRLESLYGRLEVASSIEQKTKILTRIKEALLAQRERNQKALESDFGIAEDADSIQMPSAQDQIDRASQLRAARERKLQEQTQTQGGF